MRIVTGATLFIGAVGCSDYKFTPKEFGALSVDPPTVAVNAACEYEERTVTLQSIGDFAVTVQEISVEGTGWTLSLIHI